MKYLINRARVSLTVDKMYKVENGYRLITHLPNKKDIKIIAIVNQKKLRGIEIERGGTYTFEGFLNNTKYFHNSRVYTLQLNIDHIENLDKNNKLHNIIDIVGHYKSKTKTKTLPRDKKVCNLNMDFISENMKDTGIEIAVWNKAIDAIEYATEGQKIHISAFVYENFGTDNYLSLKLSPFKITLL